MNYIDKCQYFHSLHHQKEILVLPNAWDTLSARMFELSGAKAIGTTSAGMASCFGFCDGERIDSELFFAMLKQILKNVNIPVSVDIESGMGENINDICDNIEKLIQYQVAGINVEDSKDGELLPSALQVEKIRAIKTVCCELKVPIFINARIDTFWLNSDYTSSELFAETLLRAKIYKEAGADGIFVPNLNDFKIIQQIVQKIKLPINILSNNKMLLDELNKAGASRLSIGSLGVRSVAKQVYKIYDDIIKTGVSECLDNIISYHDLNYYFQRP